MPVIQMPEKEPEPEPTQATQGKRTQGKPSDKDIIDQIQESVMDESVDDEPLIQVTERVIPEEDDVFGERPTPKVKPIIPADDEEEGDPTEEPCPAHAQQEEFKPTGKRKYTRKAPMSQKQKDHLARIRKIASEKRAKERELKEKEKIKKEEEKEEARIKKAEERLLAKQRKEQEKINGTSEPVMPKIPPQPQTGFTREDMEKAMFSAIASYETIRKKEKEEKKQKQLAEARQKQMQRTLQQAIQPQAPPDPWRQFFA